MMKLVIDQIDELNIRYVNTKPEYVAQSCKSSSFSNHLIVWLALSDLMVAFFRFPFESIKEYTIQTGV